MQVQGPRDGFDAEDEVGQREVRQDAEEERGRQRREAVPLLARRSHSFGLRRVEQGRAIGVLAKGYLESKGLKSAA